MGTRSLTIINDENGKEICVLYRQFDGYPSGNGVELATFLRGMKIVNGITGGDTKKRIANGMACLAAQIIAHFKTKNYTPDRGLAGSYYLYPAGTRDVGEEFIYTIYLDTKNNRLRMRIQAGVMTFFGMPGTKQGNMPVGFDGYLNRFGKAKAKSVEKRLNKISIQNNFVESQPE